MKKAELESHFCEYGTLEATIGRMLRNREVRAALSTCLSSLPHIVPMTKYRKREGMEPEIPPLLPFEVICRYAPPLFEHTALESLVKFVQVTKRLARHPNGYLSTVEAALAREELARRVWNRLEKRPGMVHAEVCAEFAVSEHTLLEIIEPWEQLGIARRKQDRTGSQLYLVSRLDEQSLVSVTRVVARVEDAEGSSSARSHARRAGLMTTTISGTRKADVTITTGMEMEYVIVFLAGALAAASGLAIWHFRNVLRVRKDRASLQTWADQLKGYAAGLVQQRSEQIEARRQLDEATTAYESRRVRYEDLLRENHLLKQDLFNFSVQLRKTERDHQCIEQRQQQISQRASELANRYLKENVAWITGKLTSSNYPSSKQRLLNVVEACRSIGFDIPPERIEELVQDLKHEYERVVREEYAREEQSRIRAQIREEEKLKREIDKQIQDAEREQAATQAALEKALKETKDEHSAQVEYWKAKAREAEEKTQRARSQAQLTKSGYVYVLSNIGAFGEGVYKIGMTRRLEPLDRVKELGDASVPFPFDVHMMISCSNAPGLENTLHRELHKQRMNKVNFRKEFFRIDLNAIRQLVEARHGHVEYIAEPEALEYRESLNMTDEDYEFVERTLEPVTNDDDEPATLPAETAQ